MKGVSRKGNTKSNNKNNDTTRLNYSSTTILSQQQQNTSPLAQAKAINNELINAASPQHVLGLFISKGGARGLAGGGAFNSVNYSTCFHRLARFATTIEHPSHGRTGTGSGKDGREESNTKLPNTEAIRRSILGDPRLGVLSASLCEALAGAPTTTSMSTSDQEGTSSSPPEIITFHSRELSNIAWAIAKIRLAPPSTIFPIVRSDIVDQTTPNKGAMTMKQMQDDLIACASLVRTQVLEVAKERSTIADPNVRAQVQNRWIPTLSQLSGKLLDMIAMQVLNLLDSFNPQEMANLLWAFATAGRADDLFFDKLVDRLVTRMEQVQDSIATNNGTSNNNNSNNNHHNSRVVSQPKPQELSNSIWALASAGIRGKGQVRLIRFAADTLDADHGNIVGRFKAQELSNTAWGIATLLSKRTSTASGVDRSIGGTPSDSSQLDYLEDDAALRALRWVATALQERVHEFKPQELSNSIWAFATVGFGCAPDSVQFNSNSDYISLASDRADDDRELVARTLQVVAISAMGRLHRFRPQELNNLAWGFARLGHYSDIVTRLFEGVGEEILKRHHLFAPQVSEHQSLSFTLQCLLFASPLMSLPSLPSF